MNHDPSATSGAGSASPLSVAFVCPAWPTNVMANGVIPYIDMNARELCRHGHRAAILALTSVGEVRDVDGVRVRDIRPHRVASGLLTRTIDRATYRLSPHLGQRRQFTRSLVEECRRLIDEEGLQLLEMEDAFGTAHPVRARLPIPVVVRLHGPWFLNGPLQGAVDDAEFRRRVRLEGETIASADAISSPSQDVLDRTREYYGLKLENAVVYPPPTPTVPAEDRWRIEASEPGTVLFIGRFDLHKGGDLVLKAFGELARRRPDARLRFVGPDRGLVGVDGSRVGIGEFIRREVPEAADRIEWLGQQPGSALGKLRRAARVTVVGSRYETFGLTLTEALMAGCPTVATRAGAFPEIVQDGVNGLLCAPEDPIDLADKVDSLLGDDALAARLGSRAALDGEGRYEVGALYRVSSPFYRRVIGGGRHPGRGGSPP